MAYWEADSCAELLLVRAVVVVAVCLLWARTRCLQFIASGAGARSRHALPLPRQWQWSGSPAACVAAACRHPAAWDVPLFGLGSPVGAASNDLTYGVWWGVWGLDYLQLSGGCCGGAVLTLADAGCEPPWQPCTGARRAAQLAAGMQALL